MLAWEAVIVLTPGPLMVTVLPAIDATARLLLVKVNGAGLREDGATMSKGLSVSVLVIAAKAPSGGPWSGSLHAAIRHSINNKPTIRFMLSSQKSWI
jgi:hypothetical protein